MPLVAWTVLVYCGSLIVVLGAASPIRAVITASALACTAGWAFTGARLPALVSAVVSCASVVAILSISDAARCAATLTSAREWSAEFENAVSPGELARVVVTAGGCSARAIFLVTGGGITGGQAAAVHGRATQGERGLFIEGATISGTHRGALF